MCFLCDVKNPSWPGRRGFLLAAAGGAATVISTPLLAQVNVGPPSGLRSLVPANEIEGAATQEYTKLLAEARAKGVLAGPGNPQLQRLQKIGQRLVPFAAQWNDRSQQWRWELNLITSKELNAFCMPGGKVVFYTGIIDQLRLTDDEIAMIMGHEMAHALRFSRDDESDADLVGLELAARGGYNPQAAVSLWQKMAQAGGGAGGPAFLSTHPSGPERIQQLQANVPKVQGLYERARV